MMALELVTAPTTEPISLDAAKLHLRVDSAGEDTLIKSLIVAARQRYEGRDGILRRAFLTQTWDLWLDCFPDCIRLPLAPVQSVSWVKYTDTAGVLQTLDPARYQVDLKPIRARVLPAYNDVWPLARVVPNAVNVRFVAGYGDDVSKVPQPIVGAMLRVIGHWYENREADGDVLAAIDADLMPYRVW